MELFARILAVSLLVLGTKSVKIEDSTTGYSRISVVTPKEPTSPSPGIRKYRYDISHDPEGRDFSIHFNPFISNGVITENSLQSRNGVQDPQDYDQPQLTIDVPSYMEQERSSKNIQAVHSAYAKGPDGMSDLDLGIMGYGDFMDGPDGELGIYPKSAPVSIAAIEPRYPKLSTSPVRNFKQFKFQPISKPPISPPKKFNFPKPNFQPEFGQKVQVPKGQYVYKPVKQFVTVPTRKPLFAPVLQDGHLKGLGDKAYSKVFMSQGHAKDVVKLYPKTAYSRGDFSKALFVPVVYVPDASQAPMNGLQVKPFTFKPS